MCGKNIEKSKAENSVAQHPSCWSICVHVCAFESCAKTLPLARSFLHSSDFSQGTPCMKPPALNPRLVTPSFCAFLFTGAPASPCDCVAGSRFFLQAHTPQGASKLPGNWRVSVSRLSVLRSPGQSHKSSVYLLVSDHGRGPGCGWNCNT